MRDSIGLHMQEKDSGDVIFFRIGDKAKASWVALCNRRGVKQNAAGVAMIDWIMRQPADVQVAIFGRMDDASIAQVISRTPIASPLATSSGTDIMRENPQGQAFKPPMTPEEVASHQAKEDAEKAAREESAKKKRRPRGRGPSSGNETG